MTSLLITKGDEKTNTVVTINGKGVFYQELRLGDRPMSARVRLGKLVVVDDEIVVEFDAWCEYDALLAERNTLEKTKSAAKDVVKSLEGDAVTRKQSEIEQLTGAIARLEKRINEHPVRGLTVLSAKVMASVDKMLDKVRHKHQSIETTDKTIQFTHHPSKEYFLEKQATELLTQHNERLESRGIDEGYLDFDGAMEIVQKRFTKKPSAKPITPSKLDIKMLVTTLEASSDKLTYLKGLDISQLNILAKHYHVAKGSKADKIQAIVNA